MLLFPPRTKRNAAAAAASNPNVIHLFTQLYPKIFFPPCQQQPEILSFNGHDRCISARDHTGPIKIFLDQPDWLPACLHEKKRCSHLGWVRAGVYNDTCNRYQLARFFFFFFLRSLNKSKIRVYELESLNYFQHRFPLRSLNLCLFLSKNPGDILRQMPVAVLLQLSVKKSTRPIVCDFHAQLAPRILQTGPREFIDRSLDP